MSLDFGKLLQDTASLVQAQRETRARIQLARLGDKWETITFNRDGAWLAPQTVRIEFNDSFVMGASSAAGVGFASRGVLFGLKDHPTLPDLDVDEWDTFVLGEKEYTIVLVNRTLLGQMQCQFEAVGS